MREYEPYFTEDGSIGLYSYADKDVYHSKFGALTEAWEKFVIPSNVNKLIENKNSINILDVCYGIGYNTKALMSFIIDKNNKKNKKIYSSNFKYIDKIYRNNNTTKNKILSAYSDAIEGDNNFVANIDCLDINKELVQLSPFFKTLRTPNEIFSDFVPDIFDCFETYYKMRDLFTKLIMPFYPKNKREIKELLDLKFKTMYIEKEYKVNKLVNYILINRLSDMYKNNYPDKNIKNIVREKHYSKFFEHSMFKYANFNRLFGYKTSNNNILSAFLHNIYYAHLSFRNKNINFKNIERLFNIHFYINDARKSIQTINRAYDCIFLDAFSYTKAPQLWSVEFIAELAKRLNETGVLLTYSNSAQVRNTLLENKLYVGKIYNEKAKKFIGTIESKDKSKIEYPLNSYEIGLCNTKAGIPYHDPQLKFSKKDILDLREYEFRNSQLMSSSKYMKLRNAKGEIDEDEI